MKKSKPLVSVIMPAFNAQQYIKNAIESILTQTFRLFELIIIDDSSTDKTRSIISMFLKDPRVKLLTRTSSHNIADVLNAGIKSATADIIARMDADDISLETRLEKQFSLITSSENIAVVGANIAIIDSEGNHRAVRQYPETSEELKKCLFRYSPFAHPVVMFRRRAFESVGGYNPKYSPTEDLDLWFRLGKNYSFRSVSEVLLKYRVYEKSSSHAVLKDLEKLVFHIRKEAIINYGYRPSMYDVGYNLLQLVTLGFMPVKFRIALYNLLRNNSLI